MKRGTGLPQLFAFGLIMIMSLVLFVFVFFLRSGDAPVTENVDSELANFTSYYVLNGFLNQKVDLDDFYLEDPRVRDVIIAYELEPRVQTKRGSAGFGTNPEYEYPVLDEFPDLFESLESMQYEFSVDEKVIMANGFLREDYRTTKSEDCKSFSQASTTLSNKPVGSTINENIDVKLVICEEKR